MKVVHLITADRGGAAKAALRLNEALNESGVVSNVVTMADVLKGMGYGRRIIRRGKSEVFKRFPVHQKRRRRYFNDDLDGVMCHTLAAVRDADIIHLHWVAEGMLSLSSLKRLIAAGKPVVWTLHDMHPFTGGCHYDDECGRYRTVCGACPAIESKKERDFSSWNQAEKIKILKDSRVTVVGCSSWIADCAGESAAMRKLKRCVIPNAIDTAVYKPVDRRTALTALKLERFGDKKIILFGAIDSTSDDRKGYAYLKQALARLDASKYACLVFGGSVRGETDMEIYSMGFLQDDLSLSLLYSCADVFVAPSIQENLANTVLEALACGTPVAAFRIGGMPDMITHRRNGYLARAFEADDLANGIEFCCENPQTGINARADVLKQFTYKQIADRYKSLYEEILGSM